MAAPNLGAGDGGKDAAPTQFNTQSVASHLGRRGRTTCSAQTNALREVPREIRRAPGKAEVYTTVRVGRDFGERERTCRFWACFARRGLFWACFSPATDDENCDATKGAPHERSRGAYAGEWEDVRRACVGCTRASGVIIQHKGVQSPQGKWHRAGLACSTGQACSVGLGVCRADQVCRVVRLEAAFVWRGRGARESHVGDGARFSVHAALEGSVRGGHIRIVRTDVAWSSL